METSRSSTLPPVMDARQIHEHNRRSVPPNKVAEKLKRAFECAQKHLNDGFNSNWLFAKEMLKTIHRKLKDNVGIAWDQGSRPAMEDMYLRTKLKFEVKGVGVTVPLFAVFDGHRGAECADFLQKFVPGYFEKRLPLALEAEDQDAALFNLFKVAFVKLGSDYRYFYYHHTGRWPLAGTTAIMGQIIGENLWVANVGDSRAILSLQDSSAVALSEDAKPGFDGENLKYTRGAEKRGGRVDFDEDGVCRVEKDTGIAFATARAVGHSETHSGLHARSKVIKYPLKNLKKEEGSTKKNILFLASDGVFDVASTTQIASAIQEASSMPLDMLAATIITSCANAHSGDNMTGMVVDLTPFIPTAGAVTKTKC